MPRFQQIPGVSVFIIPSTVSVNSIIAFAAIVCSVSDIASCSIKLVFLHNFCSHPARAMRLLFFPLRKDIYVASFPCTPFSNLNVNRRRRRFDPFAEPSARPFLEVSRYIRSRKPRAVVTEQVKSILENYRHPVGGDFMVHGKKAKARLCLFVLHCVGDCTLCALRPVACFTRFVCFASRTCFAKFLSCFLQFPLNLGKFSAVSAHVLRVFHSFRAWFYAASAASLHVFRRVPECFPQLPRLP